MPPIERKRRWYQLTPDRFVISLLLGVCLLWLSDRFQWFGLNHHKGWPVLIAVAAVGVAMLVMLLWWIASLIFRWRFQFGIRSLLAFCLASSIVAGWLAVVIQQAKRQREVLRSINSVGTAIYDRQIDANNNLITNSEPPEPHWLRNMLGDSFFSAGVVIWDPAATDARLACLKQLTQVQVLYLHSAQVTNAGLEQLKELTQLRVLDLDAINITDAGLKHLEGLARLRQLWLIRTKVTDNGVKKLQQALPNCKIYR